jgi:hypothetical protein
LQRDLKLTPLTEEQRCVNETSKYREECQNIQSEKKVAERQVKQGRSCQLREAKIRKVSPDDSKASIRTVRRAKGSEVAGLTKDFEKMQSLWYAYNIR